MRSYPARLNSLLSNLFESDERNRPRMSWCRIVHCLTLCNVMISKKHVDNRFEVNVFFNVHLRAMELLHSACPRVLQDFGASSLQAHLRCSNWACATSLQVGIAVASALDLVHAGGLLRLDVSSAHN
jgi:hypothetical protein